jgi:DNA polymerase-1
MALIYRAHFSFSKNPRTTSKGLNTGAILGFTNTLVDILAHQQPSHLIVAFDSPEPTLRHHRFDGYKSHRQAQPEDITQAIPYIKKILAAFCIPTLAVAGYEADDIIGTLTLQAVEQAFDIYIMTPDKDFAQLVREHVYLYKPAFMGNAPELLDTKAVLERWDIGHVDQIRDLLALQGDASDNIPGIPGIGIKTAQKLIKEFGSLENVIAQSFQLKGKLRESIEQHAQQGILSKELATIHTHVPLAFELTDSLYQGPDTDKLKTIFQELEFNSLTKRLLGFSLSPTNPPQATLPMATTEPPQDLPIVTTRFKTFYTASRQYHLIDTPALREQLRTYLAQQPVFCFDTETTSLDPYQAQLVGMSFSYYPGEAYYVPIPADQTQARAIVNEFLPQLESPTHTKVGQNIKYDNLVLRCYGITVCGPFFDTMIAHSLLAPDRPHNINAMAEQYLGYSPIPITTLIGNSKSEQKNMRSIETNLIKAYACEDADIALQLKNHFSFLLEKEGLLKLFEEIEMPLIPVLTAMEHQGVQVDTNILTEIGKELNQEMATLEKAIHAIAGEEFNLNSPKQLGDLLFSKLKIVAKPPKTKTGQYATHERILADLIHHHPVIEKIIAYRAVQKLLSTYVEALPKLIVPTDGRIHTSYNQATVTTGRLSANNPNLQNIPIRTEKYKTIRKAFVPSKPDHVLLSADYSQIELRLMAAFSEDPSMIAAFKAGEDIHIATASKLFQVAPEVVDEFMRRQAKTANFGIIYGISSFGLAQRLGIGRQAAQALIDAYFQEFKGIKAYMERVVTQAREQSYVSTLMGRRRYLPDIHSKNVTLRNFAERNAINTPLQGTAAEMIKLAMIHIHQWLEKEKMEAKLILQVHDELVFDIPTEEVAVLQPVIVSKMQQAMPLAVPIVVHVGVGKNWAEVH